VPLPIEPTNRPTAIVTGAGSGVGRAVARALVEAGYVVALAGRRADALHSPLAGMGEDHGSFVAATDVTDAASVQALFELAAQRLRRLDLLVNNAGTFGDSAPIERYPIDSWTRTLETNLTGAFMCAQHAYAWMARQQPSGGRIINNGSISAQVPRPHAVAYTVSKHGITGLTKALALEGRRHGIACGQIDIGNAATEMTGQIAAGTVQADGSIRPEPTMSVQHVADAVLYMAGLPPEANVLSITVMATTMPFVGRG
jgi:NAD(P)-dependent dehydrogenase (short-subunit alcohol dehydrogenase family)